MRGCVAMWTVSASQTDDTNTKFDLKNRFPRRATASLREVNQSLDWFDLVLVFTTPCASGAGAGLLSGGVVSGGVVSRLFWILVRDLVILAASGAGVVGCASAGLLAGSAALAVLATNQAATSDSVARTVSVRRIF